MIMIDVDVEQRKNRLSLRSDFSLNDLYTMIDTQGNGSFEFRQFEELYAALGLFPPVEHLRLAFREMDRNLDGKIELREFVDNAGPRDKNYRDVVIGRKAYNEGTNFSRKTAFTPETMSLVIGLLKAFVEAEADLERVRCNLSRRRNFRVDEAFKALDTKETGNIELDGIRKILQDRHIFCEDSEI